VQTELWTVYQLRNRYYHANLGKFFTRDPLGYVDGPNLYQYVGGKPVISFDPMGLCGALCNIEKPVRIEPGILPVPPGFTPSWIEANQGDYCWEYCSRVGPSGFGSGGVTICIKGFPILCICNDNVDRRYPKFDPGFLTHFKNCILQHERCHATQVDCQSPDCNDGEEGTCMVAPFKPGLLLACAECECYNVGLTCLKEYDCGGDTRCEEQRCEIIKEQCEIMNRFCNGCPDVLGFPWINCEAECNLPSVGTEGTTKLISQRR